MLPTDIIAEQRILAFLLWYSLFLVFQYIYKNLHLSYTASAQKESSEKQLKRQLPNVYYVFRVTTRESGSFSYVAAQYFRGPHADLFRIQLAFRHYEDRQGQKPCGEKLHFSLSDHHRVHCRMSLQDHRQI